MRIFLLCIYIAGVIINPVYAQTLKPQELLERKDYFDQKNLCVEAEVLEVLKPKEGAWINVGEDGNSLGLWLNSHDLLPVINYTASYKSKGDVIEACGVFYKASPLKQGELLVDVNKVIVTSKGYQIDRPINEAKKDILNKTAVGLLFIILLFIIKRYCDVRRFKKDSRESLS